MNYVQFVVKYWYTKKAGTDGFWHVLAILIVNT